MENEGKLSSEPVTVLLARNVRPERVNDFEEWVRGINQVVREFAGYQGTDLIRPRDAAHLQYVIVLRFDSYEHLGDWMGSAERAEWVKRSEDMTVGEIQLQEVGGLAPWFTLPDHSAGLTAPPKYKMALLTILALYPALLVFSTSLTRLLSGWPRPLLMLLTVILLVPIMTYTIMPWMTKRFCFWLYPEAAR